MTAHGLVGEKGLLRSRSLSKQFSAFCVFNMVSVHIGSLKQIPATKIGVDVANSSGGPKNTVLPTVLPWRGPAWLHSNKTNGVRVGVLFKGCGHMFRQTNKPGPGLALTPHSQQLARVSQKLHQPLQRASLPSPDRPHTKILPPLDIVARLGTKLPALNLCLRCSKQSNHQTDLFIWQMECTG